MTKYTLYSTGCPNCKALEHMLVTRNIEFTLIAATPSEMLAKGWSSTPILVVNDTDEALTFFEAYKRIKEENL